MMMRIIKIVINEKALLSFAKIRYLCTSLMKISFVKTFNTCVLSGEYVVPSLYCYKQPKLGFAVTQMILTVVCGIFFSFQYVTF
jgi:hypothetical protein